MLKKEDVRNDDCARALVSCAGSGIRSSFWSLSASYYIQPTRAYICLELNSNS